MSRLPLPPRWVRRVVVAPAVYVGCLTLLTATPLLVVVLLLVAPLLPGRWRLLRVAWFALLYAALEVVALSVLFVLWLATGFGVWKRSPWSQRLHYRLVGLALLLLRWEARRVLEVRIIDEEPPVGHEGRPLVVMARHAGPGDSFLLVDSLVNVYAREPRIVLKDTLQWDPMVDVALNRLPSRFIEPNPHKGQSVVGLIGELAQRLDHDDALLIFPEGGNVTPRRKQRAVDRLRANGLERQAREAAAMKWVMAPRPGGAAAALVCAPEADVLFVAHAGLDHLTSPRDLWRHLGDDIEVRLRWWLVPAAQVPRDPDAVADWLFTWWATIDAWVDAQQQHLSTQPG